MIDPHVHLRDDKQKTKETLFHGMLIGMGLGIEGFFDMPNTDPPLTNAARLRERIVEGRNAARKVGEFTGNVPFYGVYGGLTADAWQIIAMVRLYQQEFPAMVGLKLFAGHSTGNMGVVDEASQQLVYHTLAQQQYKGVLAVHCEKEALLQNALWDPLRPQTHSDARPAIAEISSVADQIAFAREAGFQGTLHICHISTAGSLALVCAARAQGMRITCGATAHHALFNREAPGQDGNRLKMNPPLRDEADRQAVFNGLLAGTVDWIESDHAPHTLQDKAAGASGIPGFVGTALLIGRLRQAGASEPLLRRVAGGRVCEVFGLHGMATDVPNASRMELSLEKARAAYPWDPFTSLS